jgi:hypothetical protein
MHFHLEERRHTTQRHRRKLLVALTSDAALLRGLGWRLGLATLGLRAHRASPPPFLFLYKQTFNHCAERRGGQPIVRHRQERKEGWPTAGGGSGPSGAPFNRSIGDIQLLVFLSQQLSHALKGEWNPFRRGPIQSTRTCRRINRYRKMSQHRGLRPRSLRSRQGVVHSDRAGRDWQKSRAGTRRSRSARSPGTVLADTPRSPE